MCRILHLCPYKPLSTDSTNMRETFVNDVMQRIDDGDIHVIIIWFTDEAYFYLDSFVNKRNWLVWGTENPPCCYLIVSASEKSNGLGHSFFQRTHWLIFQNINDCALRYANIHREFVMVQNGLKDIANTSGFIQNGD